MGIKANQTNVYYVTGSHFELKNSRFIHGLGMKSFIHDFLVSSLVVFNEWFLQRLQSYVINNFINLIAGNYGNVNDWEERWSLFYVHYHQYKWCKRISAAKLLWFNVLVFYK